MGEWGKKEWARSERERGREGEKEQVGRGTIESGAKRVREWGERGERERKHLG